MGVCVKLLGFDKIKFAISKLLLNLLNSAKFCLYSQIILLYGKNAV